MMRAWLDEATRVGRVAASYEILEEPDAFVVRQEANLAIQVNEAVALPLPVRPTQASDRMRAQSGLFLAEPLSRDWLARSEADGHWATIDIPAAWKRDLLTAAVRTNNSAGTLFPGL